MYFDITPKTSRKDLFGFDKECAEIERVLEQQRLIVLRGLRRTGKTSLMNVVYSEIKHPKLFIDSREIAKGRKAVYEHIGRTFYDFLRSISMYEKAKSYLEGLDIYVKLSFREEKGLSELAKRIDKMMEDRNDFFCLFIDEVQLLKPSGFDRFLAFIYDRLKRIKIILAGSEIGILDKFIGSEIGSLLYGRPKKVINLRRLERKDSITFLRTGFAQLKINIRENEIETAVDKLDGVIGWLTYYGFYRQELFHEVALSKTLKDSSKIIAAELKEFLNMRIAAKERYLFILASLSQEPLSWNEIKNFIIAKSGQPIPDSRLSNLLDQLQEYGFIEEKGGKYNLGDPIIKEALKFSAVRRDQGL
ncbi:MAG: ATP-binding protein [Candidatus Micrarchaeota archaeon]